MLYPKYVCDKGQKKSPSIDGLSLYEYDSVMLLHVTKLS